MWWQTLQERLLGWSCRKLCMRHLLTSSSLKLSLPSSRDTPICSSISSRSAIHPTPILICMEPWMKSTSFISITLLMLVSWVDIEYFIDLHSKIKDKHRLDKTHEGPKVGGILEVQACIHCSHFCCCITHCQIDMPPGQYACIAIESISHGHGGDESSQ